MSAEELCIEYIYKEDAPYLRSNEDNSVSIIMPNALDEFRFLAYKATENKDSLIIEYNKGITFSSYGTVQWFPAYVKKTKKIDYEQFKRSGDLGINYKEPLKTKKKK